MVQRYLGIAEETVLGTWVQPSDYLEIIRESLVPDMRKQLMPTSRKRAPSLVVDGRFLVSGDVSLPFVPEKASKLLKWLLGSVTTTTLEAGIAFQHVIKPVDAGEGVKSFSLEVALEIASRKISGCLLQSARFEATLDNPILLTGTIAGCKEIKGTAGTPTYTSTRPFNFKEAAMSIAGAAKAYVRAFDVTINNNIPVDELFSLGKDIFQRVELGNLGVDGTLEADFKQADEYDRFLAANTFALQLKGEGPLITGSSTNKYTLQIDLPKCLYTRDTVAHIDARNPFRVTIPFSAVHDPTTDVAVSLTLKNGEATL